MNSKHIRYSVMLLAAVLLFTLLGFVSPSAAIAADGKLYYIQIGIFRVEKNARDLKQKLSAHTPRVVVHGLESSRLGRIYKVFVGPYATKQEANSDRLSMAKEGVVSKDAFVITSSEPFPGSLPIAAKPTVQPIVEAPVSPPTEPRVIAPAEPAPPKAAPPPQKAEEKPPTQLTPAFVAPAPEVETQRDIDLKETKVLPEGQGDKKGRNLGKGGFRLAYSHTYGEYQNKIDSRKARINGTTTSIPVSTIQNLNFNTTMHRDMLRLRYGALDRLELFADLGLAYGESVTPKFVYGGGARFEFYRPLKNQSYNLFFALQGDFLAGELETEFTSTQNAQWTKVSDWYEATLRLETGMRFSRWAPFIGLSYSLYGEDTERTPDESTPLVPASTKYVDELSADTPFSVYGGADFDLTNRWRLTFEGRIGTFNGLSGSIQYNFK